jgi:anthranilate synthase component I
MPNMLTIHPSIECVSEQAKAGATLIPVYCELLSDNLTPVMAFARLDASAEHAFILESVVGGEKIARYSFLGANPREVFLAKGRHTQILQGDRVVRELDCPDPLAELERIMADYHAPHHLPGMPRFLGGAVGYASYDLVRFYEPLPNPPPDDRHLPDLLFGLYDTMVIFDHVFKTVRIVSHVDVARAGVEAGYKDARESIERVAADLSRPALTVVNSIDASQPASVPYTSNMTQQRFEEAVAGCLEYIRAGDIFQVVLSQRLHATTTADPFNIYRALRAVNPSPFMFYLKSPHARLVGSSPEIMCRVEDGIITNRPLAGTRRRGKTEAEDKQLEKELLADPKERAEHVMLVDLGRNDVGRVAELGSIKLTEIMSVERYSHVMHISSEVVGKMAAGQTAFDALRATLPVGTVSGAPKVRAMQIIDEFEPTLRGPYAGAVGYFDFAGNMDTCIALRTMVITPAEAGKWNAYVQAGAGLVADSVPSKEYEETMNKAAGMFKAIDVAEKNL